MGLKALGVRTINIAFSKQKGQGGMERYESSFDKLWVAHLFEYSRVIFLEMDFLPMRSLDYYFNLFSDVAVPYAAPRMYWLSRKSFSQAGPFIVDPRPNFWDE